MLSPSVGQASASSSVAPSATARCWLMSASMASTGRPASARYATNSDDSVVLPLPPLPTNAIFTPRIPSDNEDGFHYCPATYTRPARARSGDHRAFRGLGLGGASPRDQDTLGGR